MGTGMHKVVVVGAVVAALGLVAPAFGKPALPEGYKVPSSEPGVWAPMAVKALGERGEAMARFYGIAGPSPQVVNQRQLETLSAVGVTQPLSAIDAHQRQVDPVTGGVDANQRQVEPSQPLVVSGNSSSFDWGTFGIGAGTAALIAALGLAGLLGLRVRSTVAHP